MSPSRVDAVLRHGNNSPPLTDVDIIRLAQETPQTTIAEPPSYLFSPDAHETLISYLHSRSKSPSSSSAVAEYTLALLSFASYSHHSSPLSSLISSLLLAYIELFNSRKIPRDGNSLKTIQLFVIHLEHLPHQELPPIGEAIISNMSNIVDPDDAQLLEILPRCLELICFSEEIEEGGQLIYSFLDRIFSGDWSKGLLVKLVSVIRDFSFLDKNWRRKFLDKVFDGLKIVDLQDLPSLVYQLLVAASKGFNKREVLQGIVMFFGSEMGSKVTNIVRQVEGTVLLHVNFAVKQDLSLGQEVMGLLKCDLRMFNHFTVAVLLSVARVRKFSENCMQVLKSSVVTAYRDYKFSKSCKWMPESLKTEYLRCTRTVEKSVLRAVNESNYGREHVVPSIVQFGFLLLGSTEGSRTKELDESDGIMGIEGLGIEILKTLFQVHDMSRSEIIEQCKFRILSSKGEQGKPLVRTLGLLVQSYPYPMLEHVPCLKELLDYFTYMHSDIALSVINALLPLVKFSHDLQDYIILVLRKAMFSREDTIRLAAGNAIIDLILADKQSKKGSLLSFQESSSQASCSQQQDELMYGNEAGLFLELSSSLHRCLYQQAKVKEILYHGLVKLVLVDPLSAGSIFDFLFPHFLKFYREDTDELSITSCVKSVKGKIQITEPLDCLLSCVSWILLLQSHGKSGHTLDAGWTCFGFSLSQDDEGGRIMSGDLFSNFLQNIRKLLRNGEVKGILGAVQDTVLNEAQGTSSSSLEEEKQCCATILLGIIEVILNNVATGLEKAADAKRVELQNEIIDLVNTYETLQNEVGILRQDTRRGNRKTSSKGIRVGVHDNHTKLSQEYRAFLGTSCIRQLLYALTSLDADSQNHTQSCSGKLSVSSAKMISFVLNASHRHIKSFSFMGKRDPMKALIYGDIMTLGPPLLKLIWVLRPGPHAGVGQKKKEARGKKDAEERKDNVHIALVCLRYLITISLQSPGKSSLISDLLSISAADHAPKDVDTEGSVKELCSEIDDLYTKSNTLFLHEVIKPLFTDFLSISFFRELEILCDIILEVGTKLSTLSRNSVGEWIISMCKNSGINDCKLAKSLITVALHIMLPPDDLGVAEDIACYLLDVTMLDESESGSEISQKYSVINRSTVTTVASVLIQFIETSVSEMQWAVLKLKASTTIMKNIHSLDQLGERAPEAVLEEILYLRAEAVVKVLSPFMEMSLSLKDSQVEQLLRLAMKTYKQVALMSKLRIAPKGFKQGLPTPSFQSLVDTTCKQLTVPLYNFIAIMQQAQLEREKKRGIINKIKRENRCIPDLIFQIENYEKYLIQLTKATKVNLLRYAKRSTARDFRINPPNVPGNVAPNNANVSNNNSNTAYQKEGIGNVAKQEVCQAVEIRPNEEVREDDDNIANEEVSEAEDSVSAGEMEAVEDEREEDSASGDEDGGVPNAKRAKMNKVVEDSESEEDAYFIIRP